MAEPVVDTCFYEEYGANYVPFDFVVSSLIVAGFFIVRFILSKFIFRPLGANAVGVSRAEAENNSDVEKFIKYSWHMLVYGIMWCAGAYLLWKAPWGYRMTAAEGMPYKMYMMVQFSWYYHGLFEVYIYDRKRGDFVLMLGHHVLTMVLIGYSWYANQVRWAVSITVALDIADVFLYQAKIVHISKAFPFTKRKGVIAAVGGAMVVVWAITRVGVLGTMTSGGYWHPNRDLGCMWDAPTRPWIHFLLWCLIALWVMQVVWLKAMAKIIYDGVTKKGDMKDPIHDGHDEGKKKR